MYLMGAHKMRSLGAAVSASVDATYTAGDLCDGDPSTPIRVAGGSLSAALAFGSGTINGLILANHNLNEGETGSFSGLGTVTAPAVPPGDIRLNAMTLLTSPVTAGSTTLTIATGSPAHPIVIGEAIVGLFEDVWTLPPGSDHEHRGFSVLADGEYPRLAYSKGAQARRFGGTVFLTDAEYLIVRDAYLASEENSLPTAIVPFPEEAALDVWLVTWETFSAKPVLVDAWEVNVVWQELSRYRWPS